MAFALIWLTVSYVNAIRVLRASTAKSVSIRVQVNRATIVPFVREQYALDFFSF